MPQLDKITIFNQIFYSVFLLGSCYFLLLFFIMLPIKRLIVLRNVLISYYNFLILSNKVRAQAFLDLFSNSDRILLKGFKVVLFSKRSPQLNKILESFSIKTLSKLDKGLLKKSLKSYLVRV